MPYTYNLVLVALSLLIAMQAGYVGLALATQISHGFAMERRFLIAGAALTLATGVWSMHFVGMLAMRTPVAIDYVVLPTLLSFLLCVLVVGLSIYLASLRSNAKLVGASILMGAGISTMHYVGMLAVHSTAHMLHDPLYVAGSVLIALFASGIVLRFAFLHEGRPPLLLCAVLFGCTVSAMHYTAMAGTTFLALESAPTTSQSIMSSDIIAMIVSFVACSVSGVFLLALVPPGGRGSPEDFAAPAVGDGGGLAPPPEPDLAPPPEPRTQPADSLPVESRGSKVQISLDQIVAVHANAHYTYVFNGSEDLFCPLSITEVSACLPRAMFYRTHRSHIVNLAFVHKVSKAGDAGVAELKSPTRRLVPVSRARVAAFRALVSQAPARQLRSE